MHANETALGEERIREEVGFVGIEREIAELLLHAVLQYVDIDVVRVRIRQDADLQILRLDPLGGHDAENVLVGGALHHRRRLGIQREVVHRLEVGLRLQSGIDGHDVTRAAVDRVVEIVRGVLVELQVVVTLHEHAAAIELDRDAHDVGARHRLAHLGGELVPPRAVRAAAKNHRVRALLVQQLDRGCLAASYRGDHGLARAVGQRVRDFRHRRLDAGPEDLAQLAHLRDAGERVAGRAAIDDSHRADDARRRGQRRQDVESGFNSDSGDDECGHAFSFCARTAAVPPREGPSCPTCLFVRGWSPGLLPLGSASKKTSLPA
jgi:hypothetical protein